jgi:thiamine biosynthesis lipoprotein
MKKQKTIMGMPVIIDVVDKNVTDEDINEVFSYLHFIDQRFSTYKKNSEISKINRGEIEEKDYSREMKKIFKLCEKTKQETNGYFDININGIIDPSGIVKGYAINEAANILKSKGYKNFYVEIAGDIQVFGKNKNNQKWKVGIKNPFNHKEIIKVINLSNKGIATSGTYIRGKHIYNPKRKEGADEIVSLTVIGSNIYDADRFATAAFAMGEEGIKFLSKIKDIEGYMVRKDKTAVLTKNFGNYV